MGTTVQWVCGGYFKADGEFEFVSYRAANEGDPETEQTSAAEAIEAVFANLETQTLMPSLASFAHVTEAPMCRLFGNFVEVSGSFCIDTDDEALISRFNAAVKKNIGTARYRAAKLEMERRAAAIADLRGAAVAS